MSVIQEHARFRACFDQPQENTGLARHLVLRGWCFHLEGRAITRARARIGRRTYPGIYGDPRADVARAFADQPGTAHCGFEVPVILPSPGADCLVEVLTEDDGAWHLVLKEALQTEKVAARPQAWRRLRFWLAALRGDPSGWKLLDDPERQHLLSVARVRGWLRIGCAFQHEARPVKQEHFPRSRSAELADFVIVTPSYNQGCFLGATVDSVLTQEGVRLRYHVQDGASDDESRDVLVRAEKGLKQRDALRFSWCSEADSGQSEAIMRGFNTLGSGAPEEIMAYLNSDDLLMPGVLAWVADYFRRNPELDVLYGHRVMINSQGMEVGRWYTPREACDNLRLHDLVPQETLFWRRRAWDRAGGIDPSFRFAMDWDLLLRFQATGAVMRRVPRFLGQFRVHEGQKTQAWMGEIGLAEMEQLRRRANTGGVTEKVLSESLQVAQFDSALCAKLDRLGLRV